MTNPTVPPPLEIKPWRAHKGPQEAFLKLSAFEALFGGSKGPGKTDAILQEATRYVKNPRYRGIILRRTFPQLQEILDRAHRWYPSLGAIYKGDERRWLFPSGATVACGHCHHEGDKYNYQGHEYHYMGFDQLEQFTESQYLFLISQVRSAVAGIEPYTRSTANPGGVGHGWVKRRFITARMPNKVYYEDFKLPDGRTISLSRMFVPATIYDNPTLIQTDPRYLAWLMSLPTKQRQAFLEGNWDVFEGQFFNMWNQLVHIVMPFPIPLDWERVISLDYGYTAPSSVGFWAFNYDNQAIRYREIYQEQLTYDELANVIVSVCDPQERFKFVVADPAIWADREHHRKAQLRGETGYEVMTKIFQEHFQATGQELRLVKADNDRLNGWNMMRQRLQPYTGPFKQTTAGLLFFSTCTDSIRTIPDLIHDEVHPEDLDTTGEDHPADDTRYMCMSRPKATERPPAPSTPTQSFWKDVREEPNLRSTTPDTETGENLEDAEDAEM